MRQNRKAWIARPKQTFKIERRAARRAKESERAESFRPDDVDSAPRAKPSRGLAWRMMALAIVLSLPRGAIARGAGGNHGYHTGAASSGAVALYHARIH